LGVGGIGFGMLLTAVGHRRLNRAEAAVAAPPPKPPTFDMTPFAGRPDQRLLKLSWAF